MSTSLKLNASRKTKQTPAGEIPVDWGCVPLGNLLEPIRSGKSVGGEDRQPNESEVGVLKVSAVTSGEFRPQEAKVVGSKEMHLLKSRVEGNTILINRANGSANLVGTSVLITTGHPNLYLPDKLWQLKALNGKSDIKFIGAILSSAKFRKSILDRSSGGTGMRNISSKAFLKIPVPVPRLDEQQKIASILSAWDEALQKLDALIQTKEKRKKALMQQLLTGKKRLPGFEGEWSKEKIGNLLQEVKRPVDWDDGHLYRLVSVRRRSGGFFFREPLHGREIKTKNMFTTRAGDFVIAKMQVIHGAMAMTPPEFDCAHVSGSYITLVPKNEQKVYIPYFNWLSKTPLLYHLALISSYGVVLEKMTFDLKDFLKKEIEFPKAKDEQKAIYGILNSADWEIRILLKQRETFDLQRRGLMQKLLTGKLRV